MSYNCDLESINLNYIKTFKVFAETKSFVKAAQLLCVTQPAVSKSIKLLENEIGVKLFYKSNKRIILTEQGMTFYSCINKMLNEVRSTIQDMREKVDVNGGTLCIGIQSHFARFFLLKKINVFTQKYPNVKIKLIDLPTKDLLVALENREVDFVIDALPIENIYKNLEIIPLIEEKTCFVTSYKYARNIKSIESMKDKKLILPLPRSSLRKALEVKFAHLGIDLKPFLEVETTDLIIESVKMGFGIGFVMETAIYEYMKKGEIYKIDLMENLPTIKLNYIGIKNCKSVLTNIFLSETNFFKE